MLDLPATAQLPGRAFLVGVGDDLLTVTVRLGLASRGDTHHRSLTHVILTLSVALKLTGYATAAAATL
jgi:hypothetical protein